MPASVQITRLDSGRKTHFNNLASAVSAGNLARETWLFVSPHDDDLCLSCGLLMQQAVAEGVNVQVLVVTDGRMGYCTLEQRDSIVQIRRKETYESFGLLGIPKENIEYVAYPDGNLYTLQGRRKHRPDDEVQPIEGHVGKTLSITLKYGSTMTRHSPPARWTRNGTSRGPNRPTSSLWSASPGPSTTRPDGMG